MLASLKKFIDEQFAVDGSADDAGDSQHELGIATAALAIEIARADADFDDTERRHIVDAMSQRYALSGQETEQLVRRADDRVEQSVSLYDFTRQLNDGLEYEEKIAIVRLLWDVAFTDNEINKYEEHFIRKIADLLYVAHSDYIRAKLAAQDDRQAG